MPEELGNSSVYSFHIICFLHRNIYTTILLCTQPWKEFKHKCSFLSGYDYTNQRKRHNPAKPIKL